MNDELLELEEKLSRYRPAGPPGGLRDRVLSVATPRRSRPVITPWLAVAAMLLVSIGLNLATARIGRQTADLLGPRTLWTAEAEEMAKLLNGNGQGRRYIAFCLAADARRFNRLPTDPISMNFTGETK